MIVPRKIRRANEGFWKVGGEEWRVTRLLTMLRTAARSQPKAPRATSTQNWDRMARIKHNTREVVNDRLMNKSIATMDEYERFAMDGKMLVERAIRERKAFLYHTYSSQRSTQSHATYSRRRSSLLV